MTKPSDTQELLDRIWALEQWATAHECEQRQHRIFLAENGANRSTYQLAVAQLAKAFVKLPWFQGEPTSGARLETDSPQAAS
jgi:hypothetical protein